MPDRPNILLFHMHDVGRCLQPYGRALRTPNFQALAAGGVVFRQAFCGGPTCSPARAAMQTGQSAHSCGMLGLTNLGWALQDVSHHLVHTLRTAGYHTALCGTSHIANDIRQIGYDEVLWRNDSHAMDAEAACLAGEFFAREDNRPFFLSLGFGQTHRHRWLDQPRDPCRPATVQPPGPMPDTPEMRFDTARMYDAIEQADTNFGLVLQALESCGLSENTLVILTTDHGIGFPNMKCSLYDGGIGVALIVRGPGGFSGGRAIDAMVHHVDVFPTLCDLLEIDRPHWLEGVSLLPLLDDRAKTVRDEIFSEVTYHCSYQPMRCVRTRRYKYIRHFDKRGRAVLPNTDDGPAKSCWMQGGWPEWPVEAEQLFDLLADPCEARNRIDDPALFDVAADLRARLEGWMQRTADPLLRGPVPLQSGGRYILPDEISSDGPWIDIPDSPAG